MRSIKKKVKSVIIYMLSLVIFGMLVYITVLYITDPIVVKLWKPCIPDEEAAVRLAQIVCKSYWGIDVEADAFVAIHWNYEFNDSWQVRLKKEYDFNTEIYEGFIISDESGVFISSQDGTVTMVRISDSDIEEYYELKSQYS